MLYVSEIVPIKYGKRRVYVSDTDSDFVAEVIYGEYVTDAQIRRRAPLVVETMDTYKKFIKQRGR